jgi:hypothetical protein
MKKVMKGAKRIGTTPMRFFIEVEIERLNHKPTNAVPVYLMQKQLAT